jgi:hypothetical protein
MICSPKRTVHKCTYVLLLAFLFQAILLPVVTEAEGATEDRPRIRNPKLTIEHIHYRPVRYETEKVTEPQNERPNQGGLVFVYVENTSSEPVRLRSWYLNRRGDSFYRLGGSIAWDRLHTEQLGPAETTVLEISGVSEDFAADAPFEFAFIGGNWRPVGGIRTTLRQDPIRMTFIRVLPDMKELEVHIRNQGHTPAQLESLAVVGLQTDSITWTTQRLAGLGHAICRLRLREALQNGQLLMVKLVVTEGGKTRSLYAHRHAFADRFPIGTWGARPETYAMTRHHHIDTIVQGGRSNDAFYSQEAQRYGFHTMVHTGVLPNVDVLRDLGDEPAVNCWMIHDEPDWHYTPQMMLTATLMTRKYNATKPTFITLCRNVKFFEYAFLPDIACQDHYCVTAPSSSRWPARYGTRLEETAYYTRDLKYAAEPKPIWVWTQGIANWSERPKRPVPTVNELTAQLLLNLGRGAKGILWFTFNQSVGERYPELRTAIQGWGRVMELIRDDLLGSDPVEADVQAPDKTDVAVLASWDKLFVVVFNQDYEIHDEAYPWTEKKDVTVSVELPTWIRPQAALELTGDGVVPQAFETSNGRTSLTLDTLTVARLFVLGNNPDLQNQYRKEFAQIVESERREF